MSWRRTRRRRGGSLRVVSAAAALAVASSLSCATDGGEAARPASEAQAVRDRTVEPAIPSQPGILPERVVLISIAGLRPEHYGAGMRVDGLSAERSVMPALAALAAAGAYTDGMRPAMPPAPYPAHATLVTGRNPSRHGVLGGERMTGTGLSFEGMAAATRIQGLTLWRAAKASGVAVTSLGWPSTMGARIDLLLPDMGAPTSSETWYELVKGRATPWIYERLTLFDERLPETVWPQPAAQDSLVTKIACEIARQPRTPGLWQLYYGQGATSLALFGPGDEAGLDGMRQVDVLLEELLACFAQGGMIGTTAFVITGDRAIQPVHTIATPNVALEAAGLLTKGPQHLGVSVTQWNALVRSYGGSAVVYAKNERAARLARSALETQAEQTRAYRVVSAAELANLSADPQAWFGLEAYPGYVLSNDVRGAPLAPMDVRGGSGYLPTDRESRVGFVAWGAGIRARVRISEMWQIDVGPTAAELLGVSLAGADGRPLVGLLGRTPASGPDAQP